MTNNKLLGLNSSTVWWLICATAFGYFVDAYDLIVASVVRTDAILELGLATKDNPKLIKEIAQNFEYAQSVGILLGGIIFGILGDKLGRKNILFASILTYSVANILNGFLSAATPNVSGLYMLLRFVCGFALSAELSVGIVLISETILAKTRGYGSMIVVAFGILGCTLAASLFHFKVFNWQQLYFLGGGMGIILLVFRYFVEESSIFKFSAAKNIVRGSLKHLFTNKSLMRKFGLLILIGFPIYFFVSIPIKFAKDYASELKIDGVTVPIAIITFYIALSVSDIIGNFISQKLQSRKKVIKYYIYFSVITILVLRFVKISTADQYHYILCPLMGLCAGYWALLIAYISEQVGTNFRATFSTSIPNIIRSLFIPITLLLNIITPTFGTNNSVFFIGICSCIIGFTALKYLPETFAKELNYDEN